MVECDAKIPRSSEEIRLSGIFDVLTRIVTEAGRREDGKLICQVDVEPKTPWIKVFTLLGLGIIKQPFALTPFKAEVTCRSDQPDSSFPQSHRVPEIRLRLWNPKIDSLGLKGKERLRWIEINGGGDFY